MKDEKGKADEDEEEDKIEIKAKFNTEEYDEKEE